MLMESPRHQEVIGSVRINEVQRILKLECNSHEESLTENIPKAALERVMDDMMIVLPVKDERINLLDGVLKAIPDNCQIAAISNSRRKKHNAFSMEKELVSSFYDTTRHPICMVHQKDPALGKAFEGAGYNHLLDDDGTVRNGKAEGMLTALVMAKHFNKKYIGFIDTDNYIPGAVNEYVRDYAAGFHMSDSPYTFVRLHWKHKPKAVGKRIHFKKWGRVSELTNKYLNQLISEQTGFGTEIMRTGNAGEHALTMALAERIDYSTGYSIEPYHIIHLLERFGKGAKGDPDISKRGIDVRQIETLNPHLHEDKGDDHVESMLVESLSTVYHSRLCSDALKSRIEEELEIRDGQELNGTVPENSKLPSIEDMDADSFMDILSSESETYTEMV